MHFGGARTTMSNKLSPYRFIVEIWWILFNVNISSFFSLHRDTHFFRSAVSILLFYHFVMIVVFLYIGDIIRV